MDKIPTEILVLIFSSLNEIDLNSVSKTCVYWENIINSFDLWQTKWIQLVDVLKTLPLTELIEEITKYEMINFDFKTSCLSLSAFLFDNNHEIYKCLTNPNVQKYNFAILKTNFKYTTLAAFKDDNLQRYSHYRNVINNNNFQNSVNLNSFQSTANITKTIRASFLNEKISNQHIHCKILYYFYPMSMCQYIEDCILPEVFEKQHVEQIICVPRVLLLCENLQVKNAVVVFSTSRATEFAIILDSHLYRWKERPVGGFHISKNLYATYMWSNADTTSPISVDLFEDPYIKSQCWLRVNERDPPNLKEVLSYNDFQRSNDPLLKEIYRNFKTSYNGYIPSELMYKEMNLCQTIQELLGDLPDDKVQICLANVLLVGGNSRLRYFNIRVRVDLMRVFPKFSNYIHTYVDSGTYISYLPTDALRELEDIPIHEKFIFGDTCRLLNQQYFKRTYN